jgi:hypothetical protein
METQLIAQLPVDERAGAVELRVSDFDTPL